MAFFNSSVLVHCTGVFVRDLVFFNDGNAKKLKNGLINFSKLRTMVLKVRGRDSCAGTCTTCSCVVVC